MSWGIYLTMGYHFAVNLITSHPGRGQGRPDCKSASNLILRGFIAYLAWVGRTVPNMHCDCAEMNQPWCRRTQYIDAFASTAASNPMAHMAG